MKLYKDHFDHLGNLRQGKSMETYDKIIVVCFAVVIIALMAGAV